MPTRGAGMPVTPHVSMSFKRTTGARDVDVPFLLRGIVFRVFAGTGAEACTRRGQHSKDSYVCLAL